MPLPRLLSRTGEWMRRHPVVAHSMMWMRWPYPGWGEPRKRAMRKAVDHILDEGAYPALDDPPPNKKRYADAAKVNSMVLAKPRAWDLYLAHVAHLVALEIKRELPWSITDLSPDNLRQLLASQAFFEYRFGERGYAIEHDAHGSALPATPDFMFQFLRNQGLLRGNRRATIVALLEWCRDHLHHFAGGYVAGNLELHWQYRGLPPVRRVIEGTVVDGRLNSFTAGCWGTVGFLRAVLRTAGIPVMLKRVGPHALAHFPTEDRYLSHGDDPYDQNFQTMFGPVTGDDLLVTPARWERWYGRNLSEGAKAKNVSRQVAHLTRDNLSLYLLHLYCEDQAEGKGRAEGKVFNELFADYFTLSQLEADRLWERMDAKLAELGGCALLPP